MDEADNRRKKRKRQTANGIGFYFLYHRRRDIAVRVWIGCSSRGAVQVKADEMAGRTLVFHEFLEISSEQIKTELFFSHHT